MKRFAAVLAFGLGLFVAGQAQAAGRLPQGELMVKRIGVFKSAHPASSKPAAVAPRSVEKLGLFRPAHPPGN